MISAHLRPPSRAGIVLIFLVFASLPACGGGGGGGGSNAAPVRDLGTVGLGVQTRVEAGFRNPLRGDATVTVVDTTGPFTVDPADLPGSCARGDDMMLGVVSEPTETGLVQGSVTLRFSDGKLTKMRRYRLVAWTEPPVWDLLATEHDFGPRFIDESAEVRLGIWNRSAASPVVIRRIDLPFPALELVDTPLPLVVPAGAAADIGLRFAGSDEGSFEGDLLVHTDDGNGPRAVKLRGQCRIYGEEVVTEFGSQTLDASGRTPVLSVSVPADGISLSIEAHFGGTDTFVLDSLTGPGGKVYENSVGTGPYQWGAKASPFVLPPEVRMFTVPNTDRAAAQLVSGGGTYQFRLRLTAGLSRTVRVRAFVERRAIEIAQAGILDLNVFLEEPLGIDAEEAPDHAHLQDSLTYAETLLSAAGVRLGETNYHVFPAYSLNALSQSSLSALVKRSSVATEERLNVFLMKNIQGAGGIAAMVGGPKAKGTTASGVALGYSSSLRTTEQSGFVIAHEIGHFLGLYHPVQYDGSLDLLDDTSGPGVPLNNLMNGGTGLTAGQSFVIRAHPLLRPDPLSRARPLRVGKPVEGVVEFERPEGWCGTCVRGR